MMVVEVYFIPARRRAFHQNHELTLVGAGRRPILMPRGLGVGNTNDVLSNRPQPCIVEEGPPLTARGLLPPPMDRLRVAANIEPESRNDRPLPRAIASLTVRPVIGRLFVVRSVTEIIFACTLRATIVRGASHGACPFVIRSRVQIDAASGPARSTCTRCRRLAVGYSSAASLASACAARNSASAARTSACAARSSASAARASASAARASASAALASAITTALATASLSACVRS